MEREGTVVNPLETSANTLRTHSLTESDPSTDIFVITHVASDLRQFIAGLREETQSRRAAEDARRESAARIREEQASVKQRDAIKSLVNSNLTVSIFGGALTLPILSGQASSTAQSLVVAAYLFFGTNTISCLFWLVRLSLLSDPLDKREWTEFVFIITVGHTLFTVIGLLLLAGAAVTYTPAMGIACVAVMGLTAVIYGIRWIRYVDYAFDLAAKQAHR